MKIENFGIAFLVHCAEMINHYRPVWSKLDRDEFIVVILGTEKERELSICSCKQEGVHHTQLEDVLQSRHKFPFLVSNHIIQLHNGLPLIDVIGHKNIRFMYALGKGKHNTSDWNHSYDLFLGFGPFHERQLAQFKAPVIQIGYPRYDTYFNGLPDLAPLKQQLELDPAKPTLLWLPTWRELSSVPAYADLMATLVTDYNIIVKLHPLTQETEPQILEKLQALPFNAVISSVLDNVFLFAIADKVICDYGGTAFGAIYLDKPLMLLNLPDAHLDDLAGSNSPDINLRKHIVNLDTDNFYRVYDLLQNDDMWLEQQQQRERLRQYYFASYYGTSSDIAAKTIRQAGEIINREGLTA